MRERILQILAEVNEDILTYKGKDLLKDGVISSFEVIDIVTELEDAFDIEIDAKYVVSDNFSDTESIIAMVERIMDKK